MAKKLNTYVHAVERDGQGAVTNSAVFGPDDKVPGWARKAITNPDVWADSDDEDPDAEDSEELPADRPPTSGAGSGRDAWAAYASAQGVAVSDDMDRAAIIAAVDAK